MAKVKLEIDLDNGTPSFQIYTTLFAICEWEEKFNRKLTDGRPLGAADWAFWAYTILKLRGEKMPDDYKDWLKENPGLDVTPVMDNTNPNLTGGELTEGN